MKRPLPILLALLMLAPVLGGCQKVRARAEMKKGNEMYHDEAYREALAQYQKGLKLDPSATFAWRSVGLSALALYRPGDNSKANREMGELATQAFEKYLEDYPDDEKVRDYLISTYVNTKKYDQALAYLDRQAKANPDDANIRASQVRLLIESGQVPKAAEVARSMPNGQPKAEALYSVGVWGWDKSFHGADIPIEERQRAVDLGLSCMDQAVKINPNYFEAVVYYNLLYREKAKMEFDGAKKLEYIAKADELQARAKELRKKQVEEEKKKAAEEAAKKTAKS
ncbi:MAG TPA: tetratricopeptide repeat protein [Thermoanaerobaculia bacterium]|nr:tetratricopeptide repeat protein [Thermoanaerobaculia bacterium]